MALRYLRPKRTFVSIITLISALGVTLGVGVMIIVIGVMSGFDQDLRAKFFGFQSHLRVTTVTGIMRDYPSVLKRVEANPHVRAAAPYVMGQILVETQPEYGTPKMAAQWIRGIEPELEARVSLLPRSVKFGALDIFGSGIVVGTAFADDMAIGLGDSLAVYSDRHLKEFRENRDGQGDAAPLPDDYTVKGIFDLGYYEYNVSFIVTSLQNAQDLYNLDDNVHGLMTMIDDPFAVQEVRAELLDTLGPEFQIGTWMDNSTFLDAVVVEKNVMFIVLFFITIVAAFGIMNSLITFVVNKTREIGLIKTLGASHAQVLGLFVTQSLIVGVTGVLGGLVFGMLGLSYRNEFLHFMRDWTQMELFPAEIYGFTELPALIVPFDIVLICGSFGKPLTN
jgi:lipoprotein-releasing system permease protein